VDLDAEAVVLGLDGHQPELLDHCFRVRQALCELTPNRPAHRDLERCDRFFTIGPESFRDQAEVGDAVVSAFQHRAQRAVALPRERESVEHGGIADAEPKATQRDAHQVLGGNGVDLPQQAREERALLFDGSGAGRDCDLHKPGVDLG